MSPPLQRSPSHPVAAVQLLLWRYGWCGPLAALALLAAAIVWRWELQPTAGQLQGLEDAMRAPRAVPAAPAIDRRDQADATRMNALRATLRPYAEHPQLVRRIAALTQPDLPWDQAEFQQSGDPVLGTVRVQITMRAAGDYRQLRRAVELALREVPSLSLDQVSFRRELSSQTRLEARLSWSLWLLAPESAERPRDGSAAGAPR